ncbi:MAG TPA: hypothetical protein VES66_08565 [Terriglobales bacterium]|nr:hypothetical protein [Terriglobales bacterium]
MPFVPKLVVWALRLALLLMTPLFLLCVGVARSMMWLDAWAADQLTAEQKLAQRETFEPWVSTERGDR